MASANKNTVNSVVTNSAPAEEEMVTIRLPIDRDDPEDKVVWVNNRRFLIKKGIAVEVPVSVKEILDEEEKNLRFAYNFESRVQH